jgi:signal transduction histidine kinase/CheY-like chemotaxis protein
MLYTRRMATGGESSFESSVGELLQSTSRTLIVAVSMAYLLWHLISTSIWPEQIGMKLWFVSPLIAAVCVLALVVLPRRFLVAQVIWQLGLAAVITFALYLFQRPEIAFLYTALPLMAVVTVGWPAGMLVEGIVAALVWWLSHGLLLVSPSAGYSAGILVGGATAGLLGWASSHTLLTVAQWSLVSFEQARDNMQEAREHRAELARVLKDLDQAYYRLERANRALVLARADAEDAREARNRLAMAISHELRTPLNFVIGFSELMVHSPATYAELDRWPPGLYEDIQEIYRSSAHLLRLVNDVLDLGQIEALQMTLLKEWVEPAQIVDEVQEMVRSAFVRKRLSLQIESEPDLPQLFVDHTRIRQVLLNLVSNSLRFTEQGSVTIRLRRDGERLLFSVQDTGPGIAKEDTPKLFEEFQQISHGSWRRREGAGLGIPISRRFVELHGGEMWVESKLGQGTTLAFSLPLPGAGQDAPSVPGRSEVDERYWRHLVERAEREQVLLILSPDRVAGEVIAPYVGDHGVIAVHDPGQVAQHVAELLPRALIVDRSWIDKAPIKKAIRELPYDLPVIAFHFPGSPAHPQQLPPGVANYLVKPIARQALAQAIQELETEIHSLLVVDDDPGMIRFVVRALQATDMQDHVLSTCQVATAFTGAEAIDWLRRHRPDAVLLDLALPDISGWQILTELRQKEVPTILITAYDWPQLSAAQQQEALQVTMRRPLSRRELAPVLGCLLDTIRPLYPAGSTEPASPTNRFA